MGNPSYNKPEPFKFTFLSAATAVDPARVDVPSGQCSSIKNMDTGNAGDVITRSGYELILPVSTHSGWSNGEYSYCVTGGKLCLFNGTTATPLYTLSTNATMSYCQVNRIVVASNGIDYLVIDGAIVTKATPLVSQYKVTPPAGNHLCFYNGRVYIANGSVLCCTDPYSVDTCDSRQMYMPITNDTITGLSVVDDGIYIGTDKEILFLSGTDPFDEQGMILKQVNNYGMINRTMITSNSFRFKVAKGLLGTIACWTSKLGFHVGGNGGQVVDFIDTMAIPECDNGAVMVREQNGLIHYIVVLTTGEFYNTYQSPVFDIDEA